VVEVVQIRWFPSIQIELDQIVVLVRGVCCGFERFGAPSATDTPDLVGGLGAGRAVVMNMRYATRN